MDVCFVYEKKKETNPNTKSQSKKRPKRGEGSFYLSLKVSSYEMM